MTNIQPFFMFNGNAEEAMRYYVDIFEEAEINELHRYGRDEPNHQGKVKEGVFTIYGQTLLCTDSVIAHNFNFTPSLSLYVSFESESALEQAYNALSDEGEVLMPLASYPFNDKFAWVNDRFGVSWQVAITM